MPRGRWEIGPSIPRPPPWVGRVERAYRNFGEWLPVFAILVLMAHVTGAHSKATAAASSAYVVLRIAYTAAYAAGSLLRSPLWYTTSFSMLVILVDILRRG